MVNKKGFMRIVEATIAVMIILGALFVISSQRESVSRQDLTLILRRMLDEVAKNQELREKIVSYDLDKNRTDDPNREILIDVETFLEERIKNPAFSYSVSICNFDKTCPIQPYPSSDPEDIYASERIITTTLNQQSPEIRKIKVFLWREI